VICVTTPKTRALKKAAGRNLRKYWGKSISAFIITVLSISLICVAEGALRLYLSEPYFFKIDDQILYNISLVSFFLILGNLVLVYLIYEPLKLSMKGYFLNLSCRSKGSLLSLFDAFSTIRGYFSGIMLSIKLSLLKLFWIVVLFVPSSALAYAAAAVLNSELSDTGRIVVKICVGLFAVFNLFELFFLSVLLNRYFLAPYLLISNNAYSSRDAIRKSKRLMKGNLRKVYFLHLSYMGWRWLLFFLLPALFVVPLFEEAKAELAKNLMYFRDDNENSVIVK